MASNAVVPIVGADDALGAATGNFAVILYRGKIVFNRDAWIADARARGGVGPTRVPSGFFHDAACFRFGAGVPYTYELAPSWLLAWDGIDVASDEASRALGYLWSGGDNKRLDSAVSDDLPGSPNGINWRPWIIAGAAAGAFALYAIGVQAGLFPSFRKMFKGK